MEQESREDSGAARSRHVVHITPRDPAQAARLLSGLLRREAGASDLSTVIVTPNADVSVALGHALAQQPDEGRAQPIVLTSMRRAHRLLAQRPRAIIADPLLLRQLVVESQLTLGNVQAVAFVWAEDLIEGPPGDALEALLADLSHDMQRVAIVSEMTEPLERFVERVMWRARRVSHVAAAGDLPVRFVLASEPQRAAALNAVLDALDPATTHVVALTSEGEAAARMAASALGYHADDGALSVGRELPETHVDLVVVFELPPNRELLERACSIASEVVAFVTPAQLPTLRAIAGTGTHPQHVSELFAAARDWADRLRSELRGVLRRGAHQPYVLTLEPLAGEYDPVEIAAAAMAVLQRERASQAAAARAPEPAAPVVSRPSAGQRMTRVFVNVGERDGVRRGDLVGAIAGEAGISGAQIGRIELRDSHAIVEVTSDVASRVIERLTGVMIRGRRIAAREDREPARSRPAGSPAGPRSRRSRGDSSGRVDQAPRGDSTRRDDRPRTPAPERLPRATRESEEWADRAERLRHARRSRDADTEASEE